MNNIPNKIVILEYFLNSFPPLLFINTCKKNDSCFNPVITGIKAPIKAIMMEVAVMDTSAIWSMFGLFIQLILYFFNKTKVVTAKISGL